MPKLVEYKAGSIVYFRGDRSDKIFVLNTGHIDLQSMSLESSEMNHDAVQAGEFFGVKSALGAYPREETATVVKDSKIMVFTIQEFESLCINNPRIVLKMLKVFSNQLRQINRQLRSITSQKEINADDGLYNVGEFYLKQSKYNKADYVLRKYITEYPEGNNIGNAKKNMSILEKMKKSGAL
jgi:CRP-like cAMP-binding protein